MRSQVEMGLGLGQAGGDPGESDIRLCASVPPSGWPSSGLKASFRPPFVSLQGCIGNSHGRRCWSGNPNLSIIVSGQVLFQAGELILAGSARQRKKTPILDG